MVRSGTIADRFAVITLLRRSHTAAGYAFRFEAARADSLYRLHLENPAACALLLERDGLVCGLLLASALDHPFGAGLMAKETVWFIAPEARGRSGLIMLDAYEAWAKSIGCTSIGMAALATNDVSSLYARRGYVPAETHFIKPI
ncbi:GNAT family N-acetyltransferase [Agrobacterium vitis]|uniref:GNAT family N-acetyltransferase n=1 Tax=Agrobacterium vitis TaxID=373 RepID=UPI0015731338|nr:GNAT family N-acetyltransferase [Agrobacterium vitis]NSZ52713.1 GNAT family N-acetyltransferase [Agrobacterium vitis]NTA31471.1 GNAT family N-acetyltransferase [Agrobacterium vitis]